MNQVDVRTILRSMEVVDEISVAELSRLTNLPKKRIYGILPCLMECGKIEQVKRGVVRFVHQEPEREENGHYETQVLQVSTNGFITSVQQLSGQSVVISSTADQYTVNPYGN